MSKRKQKSSDKASASTINFAPNLLIEGIQLLESEAGKRKKYRQHSRRIDKLLAFRVHRGVVLNEAGDSVNAVAFWDGTFTVRGGRLSARYMRLCVYFAELYHTYAVPINWVDEKKPLPGLAFSPSELTLVYEMANALMKPKDRVGQIVTLPNWETQRVKLNRSNTYELDKSKILDIADLAPIFGANPWAFRTFMEVFLVNLRPFMVKDTPSHIVNFVAPLGSGLATRQALLDLLSACNLTAHPLAQETVVLQTGTVRNRHTWEQGGSQLMLMDANDNDWDALLRQAERVLLDINCNRPPVPFIVHPLVFGRSLKPEHVVENISLPKVAIPWTDVQLDTLRFAMGQLFDTPKKTAEELANAVQAKKLSAIGYRISTIQAWQEAALDVIKARLPELIDAFDNAQSQLNTQAQALELRLNNAIELLTTPARYEHLIADVWPTTKAEVMELLEGDHGTVALKRTINHKKFLCFRPASLLRLVSAEGIDEVDYELFLARLKSLAILGESSKTVKTKDGDGLKMVRLPMSACIGNAETAVTAGEEALSDEQTK